MDGNGKCSCALVHFLTPDFLEIVFNRRRVQKQRGINLDKLSTILVYNIHTVVYVLGILLQSKHPKYRFGSILIK